MSPVSPIALGILGIVCLVFLVLTFLDRFAMDNRILNDTFFTVSVVVLPVTLLVVIIALVLKTSNIKSLRLPGSRPRIASSSKAKKAANTAIVDEALNN